MEALQEWAPRPPLTEIPHPVTVPDKGNSPTMGGVDRDLAAPIKATIIRAPPREVVPGPPSSGQPPT